MALMRGKFYVWYGSHPKFGEFVDITHGRDMLPYEQMSDADRRLDDLMRSTLEEQTGIVRPPTQGDPPELMTDVHEPRSVWLPKEVWDALVVRAYDRMSPEEVEAVRGPTRWEEPWDDD